MAVYLVSVGGKNYRIEISKDHIHFLGNEPQFPVKNGYDYLVLVEGITAKVSLERKKDKPRRNEILLPQGDVFAPMPGIVLKINVKKDEMVKKGQSLLVMESMKMQMEIRSIVDGKVTQIMIRPNTKVEKGTLLVRVV